jgi:ADP-heptose:LPS heptosyltransferase
LFRLLKSNRYELFIELPQSLESLYQNFRNLFIARLIGCKYGFGWGISSSKMFRKAQLKTKFLIPENERLLNILIKNNLKIYPDQYLLNNQKEDENKIFGHLTQLNLNEKDKNIAVVIGAKRISNRWPIEYFNEVIKYILSKDYNIFLIGGKDELELSKHIITDRNIHNFIGTLTPMESAVLFKYCKLTLSNDTGPMHLSYCVGTPVIAIFSNRDFPKKWYPPDNGKNIVVRAEKISCTICLKENCNHNFICTKQIAPIEIIDILKNKI